MGGRRHDSPRPPTGPLAMALRRLRSRCRDRAARRRLACPDPRPPSTRHLPDARGRAGRGERIAAAGAAMSGVFDFWQPKYAARGIATFPVNFEVEPDGKIKKVPAVRHWPKIRERASTELTRR